MSRKRKVQLADLHKKLGIVSARPAVDLSPQPLIQQRKGLVGLLPLAAAEQEVPISVPTTVHAPKEVKSDEVTQMKRPRQEVDLETLPESKDVIAT